LCSKKVFQHIVYIIFYFLQLGIPLSSLAIFPYPNLACYLLCGQSGGGRRQEASWISEKSNDAAGLNMDKRI
jgi:hypothetical protein